MKRLPAIDVDFHRSAVASWGGFVLLVLGAAAAFAVAHFYNTLGADINLWRAQNADIERIARHENNVFNTTSQDTAELRQEVVAANAVLQQMAVPWDALFKEIEAATDNTVALLSLQPDVANGQVRLSAEAKNLAAMTDFIRRLDESKLLTQIYLVQHGVKQDPLRPVTFSLVAQWVGTP